MDTGLLTEGNGLAQHNCIIMQNDFQTFKRSLLKWKLIGIFLPFLWDKSHLSGKQAIEQKGFMPSENNIECNAVVSPQIYVQSNQLLNANIILFL